MDETLHKLGDCGRYQRLAFTLLCLVALPIGFSEYGPLFWAFTPNHYCCFNGLESVLTELNVLNISREKLLNVTVPWERSGGRWRRSTCFRYRDESIRRLVTTDAANRSQDGHAHYLACPSWCYDVTDINSTIVSQVHHLYTHQNIDTIFTTRLACALARINTLVSSLAKGLSS